MTLGYSTEVDTDYARFRTMQRELQLARKALFRTAEYVRLQHESKERAIQKTEFRKAHIVMQNAINDYMAFCESEGLDFHV